MKAYGEIYKSEIDSFHETMNKFVNGEYSVAEFKGKSGGFGVYAQRGKEGFMIRLKTPCGVISYEHMDLILKYMKQYNRDSVHFTSRQAIQIHDLNADQVCEIMRDAIDYDLFTRGSGGNYPRNVALSPMSGVEKKEAYDVTDIALQINEYFTSKASTYHLPRKLKVACSNSDSDTAKATINDLGFVATVKDNKPYLKVYLAGGMGKNPAVAMEYNQLIQPEEAIYYANAYLRTFIELGDYQNRAKARTRFIPEKYGKEEFLKHFEVQLDRVLKTETFEKISINATEEQEWQAKPDTPTRKAQKQPELYTAILHPRFGKMSLEDYEYLCEFIHKIASKDRFCPELRLSMEEELYVRNLTLSQANELLDAMSERNANERVHFSFSCVGVPTCQMGIQNSRQLLNQILEAVEQINLDGNLLPVIQVSGCPNSCSRHQVAQLGFAGKKQSVHGEILDVFEVYAGGCVKVGSTHIGKNYGTMLLSNIPAFIVELGETLNEKEMIFEKFLDEYPVEFEEILSKYLVEKN